jgi:SH3-like domain-containing protein
MCTRSKNINIRNGPGENYIVIKNIQISNLPLFISHQIEDWVNIKTVDGYEGWVLVSLLKNNKSCRTIIKSGSVITQMPNKDSKILQTFNKMDFVKVIKCRYGLCRVRFKKISGWVSQSNIWGVY